eukprot:CAMPEP_0115552656 /NCGR_PEP_ID=MMETSP0271-20121206/96351_1 /TAXON_ID=71861 /ORGANISM="Scrippsiella trochoidea, Strain CCMP3099" /LENGTH=408 /DNA_ID=CAMNT_0002986279 /DNA_START=1 /DNA_END=1227 /DNA_ORIENTATION=-
MQRCKGLARIGQGMQARIMGQARQRVFSSYTGAQSSVNAMLQPLLSAFDPAPPAAAAWTVPSSWYTSDVFYHGEKDSLFSRNWLHVGRLDQLSCRGAFFSGELLGQPYIVTRTDAGEIRAMYNVCTHHAAIIVHEPEGVSSEFRCPYHGWCFKNDGRLAKCFKLKGIENFKNRDHGLKPIQVDTLGPFVFINFAAEPLPPVKEVLGEAVLEPLEGFGRLSELRFVKRVEYDLKSNWKVFCDNYLDGGYHVPVAHPDLAGGLEESAYTTRAVKYGTIQAVPAGGDSRLGSGAVYSFAYPNFMMNRYGPWLDTNTVIPTGVDSSKVIFDYFLDEAQVRDKDPDVDIDKFVNDSLIASDKVQREDEHLCAIVQRGLSSKGYSAGRYVPSLEHGMHAFHRHVHHDMAQLVHS